MKKLIKVTIFMAVAVSALSVNAGTNFVLTATSDAVKTTFVVSSTNVLTSSWNLQIATNGGPFVDVVNAYPFGSTDSKSVGFVVLNPQITGFYRGATVLLGTNSYSTTNLIFQARLVMLAPGIRTIQVVGPTTIGYTLQSSTNLGGSWQFYSSSAPGVTNLAVDSSGVALRFYRVLANFP